MGFRVYGFGVWDGCPSKLVGRRFDPYGKLMLQIHTASVSGWVFGSCNFLHRRSSAIQSRNPQLLVSHVRV